METTRIVSTDLKLIQLLVVLGWVSPMSEISDPMSAGTYMIGKNCIAVIIHLLVVTQPDVEAGSRNIYFTFQIQLARLEMRLSVFRELLSLRCINFKNLCAHHQEEVLRIPKHPQLAKFA